MPGNISHKNITDADRHEPKGISTATVGKVYVSDGNASGNWTTSFAPSGYTTTANSKNLNLISLTKYFPDIGTAGDVYVVCPIAGNLSNIYSVVDTAPATTNTILSFRIGGTLVTSGNITHTFSGSAAGDVASSTPSANKAVTAGQAIKITSDGGASNVVPCTVTFWINVA